MCGDLWASFFFKKILLIDYHIGSSSTGKSIEPNLRAKSGIAYTHPATETLLRANLPPSMIVRLSPSKYQAYQSFLRDGQFVLTSKKLVEAGPGIVIRNVYKTRMMWAIYRIGGAK